MQKYPPTSIFSHFPVELVDEIVHHSGVSELKALCLVSKQIGNVATRRLYDTIILQTAKHAVICLRTLAARQDVADCVKRIAIEIPSRDLFQSFYKLTKMALKRTINLTALGITKMDPLLALLIDIPFPQLVEIKLPYAPSLTPFLQSHRHTLKAITVESPDRVSQQHYPVLYFKSVEMPELLMFVGPGTVVPFVIPKSQVSYLTVCWDLGCENPEEVARCIAESKRSVVGMDNLTVGWNPALLGIIGMHMPRMRSLRIRSMCSLAMREVVEESLLWLEVGLKMFECLHTLTINLVFNPYQYQVSDLDREYMFIQCTRWKRTNGNYWFPIIDPTQQWLRRVRVQWVIRSFQVGRYPSDLFPEILGGVDLSAFEELIFENQAEEEECDEGEEEGEGGEEEGEEDEGTDWNESEADIGSD